MKLEKTNLQKKLGRARSRYGLQEAEVLKEVHQILNQEREKRDAIANRIARKSDITGNAFNFDALDTSRIYHLDQIKSTCIDYRLRFLDSKYFKGEIPEEAISKIKALEKEHHTTLGGFKVMAPSKLFKLEDKDDPLLFAPLGNGYYYLIHQWGNDLHPFRKILVWPFKSVINLSIVVVLLSYLATLMVPEGLFSKQSSTAEFLMLFFFMFKSLAAVVIFYGFALGKNFNPVIWNSKYFNA
ncbi:hypothetical protein [Maribacter sp. 2307ULW6-5]|uniref:hypothetical protein n=1 Tax=Maribacter sp. 2307ULW6-5 TaxID=3386275 RepID=UPI0039BC3CA2